MTFWQTLISCGSEGLKYHLKYSPYLSMYNARPCIICTLIFDHFINKKRFQDKHQELKLPFFHLINKSWEFINDMFTTNHKYRTHRAPIYTHFYSIKVKRFTNRVT